MHAKDRALVTSTRLCLCLGKDLSYRVLHGISSLCVGLGPSSPGPTLRTTAWRFGLAFRNAGHKMKRFVFSIDCAVLDL